MTRRIACFVFLTCAALRLPGQAIPIFTDQTAAAGIDVVHTADPLRPTAAAQAAGGLAVADVDLDGWPDVYVITGDQGTGRLLRNGGDGTFHDVTAGSGLEGMHHLGSGPLFFYFDADAYPDLIVGAADGAAPRLFRNRGDGTFAAVSSPTLRALEGINTSSITAADIDGDGDQDLFLSHWESPFLPFHFLRNEGGGQLTAADGDLGFHLACGLYDFTFTANFRDLNADGFPDLLLTADFGCTQLWWNHGGETFTLDTESRFTDGNGMGSAVGDADNDGDEDWFVAAIYDDDGTLEGDWSGDGNRLYDNYGGGKFRARPAADTPLDAGWGWAASFADLNLDGWLDLVVVNGWPRGSSQFRNQPARWYPGTGSGTFGSAVSLPDSLQGRGLSCLDYDGDGDLDLMIANYDGPLRLLRNESARPNDFVCFRPRRGDQIDIGSTVTLHTGLGRQIQTISAGSNYVSQNPAEARFGLPPGVEVDSVVVRFSTGNVLTYPGARRGNSYTPDAAEAIPVPLQEAIGVFPNPGNQDSKFLVPRPYDQAVPVLYSISGNHRVSLVRSYLTSTHAVYVLPPGTRLPRGGYRAVLHLPGRNRLIRSPFFFLP